MVSHFLKGCIRLSQVRVTFEGVFSSRRVMCMKGMRPSWYFDGSADTRLKGLVAVGIGL